MESTDRQLALLHDALQALRAEVAGLAARLAALEQPLQTPPPAPAAESGLSDDALVAVASAAVAAYLGVKPRIRQVRLVGNASWAEQGRATIQASHDLPLRRN
jgi:methylmalonyl-CoA carboxyltransferase large subunit